MSEQDADLIPQRMSAIVAALNKSVIGLPFNEAHAIEYVRMTAAAQYGCKASHVRIISVSMTDDHEWVCTVALPLTIDRISFVVTIT